MFVKNGRDGWGKQTGDAGEWRPVDNVSRSNEEAEGGEDQYRGEFEKGDEDDFYLDEYITLAPRFMFNEFE